MAFLVKRCYILQRHCIILSETFLRPLSTTSTSSTAEIDEKRRKLIDKIIRVDHAGELGADRIYAGQMLVFGNDKNVGPIIKVCVYECK